MRKHGNTTPRPCANDGCPYFCKTKATRYCSLRCAYDHRRKPVAERFWAKVDRNGPVPAHRPDLGPCWLWTGATDGNGYGCLGSDVPRAAPLKANRVSYELHYGPIPAGLHVCHHCDNPPCVRPTHLFVGSRLDNMRDAAAKGRTSRGSAKHRESVQRGEARYNARLTEAEVRQIRSRHAAGGVTYRSLSREFLVTASVIAQIVRRQRWKHVE